MAAWRDVFSSLRTAVYAYFVDWEITRMFVSRLAVLAASIGLSTLAAASPTQYPLTLENCSQWQKEQVCCVAAICGEVRLIDNMLCESVL